MADVQPNGLNIRIHEFLERAEPVRDVNGKLTGEIKVRDYVKYGPPQAMDRMVVEARIERLSRVQEPNSNNPAERAAWDRWQFIKPYYEAWKNGEQLPETGMPIAACNFLRSEEVAVLKRSGIRTVEELAGILDSNLDSIKVPSLREKRVQAKRFLEAQDTNKAAAQMAARDERLAEQASEIAEMKALISQLVAKQKDEEQQPPPPRRGRPPKHIAEQAA